MRKEYLSSTHDALDVVQEERELLATEIEAFEQFASTVNSLNPSTPNSTLQGSKTIVKQSNKTDICKIRGAYRESVMSVSHYKEEYGESLPVNLQAELGSEIAVAIMSDNPLTDRLQRMISSAAMQAQKKS